MGELLKLFLINQRIAFTGMVELNEDFWTSRYLNHQTGWDIGNVSTPLKEYIDQLENKDLDILIPGAGNAYEAEYLWKNGFKHVDVVDISEYPLASLKERLTDFPNQQLIHKDFFELDTTYDLIFEQTFFCALSPKMRTAYLKKMNELLNPNGKLVGVLFNIPLNSDRPPFGGKKEQYVPMFLEYLELNTMEACYNSIEPRMHNELWFNASSKS